MDAVEKNRKKNLTRLSSLFNEFGDDERSLGWTKKKQNLRFQQIVSRLNIMNKEILDIGCGFGDLYSYLKLNNDVLFNYTGIDIMPEFIELAKKKNPEGCFLTADFMNWDSNKRFDYIIACGCFFNLDPINEDESYSFINDFISKALSALHENGLICLHFLNDKVDYHTSKEDFHVSPERVLSISYGYSRRVILDNSVFPFETCIYIYKDDSFSKETTVFSDLNLI